MSPRTHSACKWGLSMPPQSIHWRLAITGAFYSHTQAASALFCFGTPPSCPQGSLMVLHSGITFGRLVVPDEILGMELGWAACKANALPTYLFLQPHTSCF